MTSTADLVRPEISQSQRSRTFLEEQIAFVFTKPLMHCVIGKIDPGGGENRRFVSGVISATQSGDDYLVIGRTKGLLLSLDDDMTFAKWLNLEGGIAGRAFRACHQHISGNPREEAHFMALMTAAYWMMESGFSTDSKLNSFYLNAAESGYQYHTLLSSKAHESL